MLRKSAFLAAFLGLAVSASAVRAQDSHYHFLTSIAVGGEGGWDYLAVDSTAHRLYVTHGTKVVVIDTQTNAVVGEIDSLPGVHGFAVAPSLGLGFASNGRENTAAVVDLKKLSVVRRVSTGENPDAILYVPGFDEVYTFNGRGQSATVFNAKSGAVVATIPLGGKPEFAVYSPDEQRIYNNIESTNQIVAISPRTHTVVSRWPIAPGEAASGLAIDLVHHRLFAVCENNYMVMLNSATGVVVQTIHIDGGADAARYDPGTRLAFSSNGEGTVTIAHLDDQDNLRVVQTLETARSARTMTLDPTTHRIYLSAADYAAPSPTDTGAAARRGRMVPGSFRVLVYGLGG
jgi:DNA-binding beta-propeller fold protein YncE